MIGTVFKIETELDIYFGCVTSYYSMGLKKPNSIGFVILENPKSSKRIAKIKVPAGIRYSFFTSHKWIGERWKIIGKIELSNLPEKLYLVKSGGWLHDLRLKETNLRYLENSERESYQTLSLGNYSASEYVLENAIIEFVDTKSKNIIFKEAEN